MSYTAKELIENTRIYEKNWLILEYAERNKLKAIKDLCLEIERKLEDHCVEIQKSLGVYVDGNKIRDHHKSPYKKKKSIHDRLHELMKDGMPRTLKEIQGEFSGTEIFGHGIKRSAISAKKKYGVGYISFFLDGVKYYQQGVIHELTQERENIRIVA